MKAIIDAQSLYKELKKISPAIKNNTVLPILTCVKLDFEKNILTVSATDLETSISVKCDCECQKPFSIVMEYADISGVCGKVSGPVTISSEKNGVSITGESDKFNFTQTTDASLFPKVDADGFSQSMDVDGDFFFALSNANQCRHTDEARINMNAPCINIKKKQTDIVATDSMLMYKHTIKHDSKQEFNIMVSPQFAVATKGFQEGTISVSERFIRCESGNTVITSRLPDSKFVNYEVMLVNDLNFNFKCNRESLIKSFSKADVAASKSTHICKVSFVKKGILISAQDSDFGKEGQSECAAEHSVDIEAIALPALQVTKLLDTMVSQNVEISFREPTKAVYMRPEGSPETVALVMPVTLNV